MTATAATKMVQCRDCDHRVSVNAAICPQCGVALPAKKRLSYGFEYKSKAAIFGIPLLHIAFKYRKQPGQICSRPVVAKGVVAIGQFGVGLVNISQFGIGMFSLAQFTIARWAIAQFAVARYGLCQMGIVNEGVGQNLISFKEFGQMASEQLLLIKDSVM
ncbi:MAG: zinc ribbon domain-containing protein [Planctomycetota bacterium]